MFPKISIAADQLYRRSRRREEEITGKIEKCLKKRITACRRDADATGFIPVFAFRAAAVVFLLRLFRSGMSLFFPAVLL